MKQTKVIGVMSDTHGNIAYMQHAVDIMVSKFAVETIIHLGDDCADTKHLHLKKIQLITVLGINEESWDRSRAHRRFVWKCCGLSFFLSHTPERSHHDYHDDLDPALARSKYGADIFLHGHTHVFNVERTDDGLLIINPGHLKSQKDRGSPPTFAVICVQGRSVEVKIVGIDAQIHHVSKYEMCD